MLLYSKERLQMPENKKPKDKEPGKKRTILGAFLAREEPDEDYIPDLKEQWHSMGRSERIKFILGGLVGLILFIGGITLIYLIILAIKP